MSKNILNMNIVFPIGFLLLFCDLTVTLGQQPPVISNFVNSEIVNHAIELKEGSSYRFSLQCNGRGQPEPQYKWFRNNVEIQNEDECEGTGCGEDSPDVGNGLVLENDNEILTFSNPKFSNVGHYHCEARNDFGMAKSEVIFVTNQLPPNPNDDGYTIPQFTEGGPQPQLIPYEKPTTLHCAAEGQPDPEIIWTKDGDIINVLYDIEHRGQISLDLATKSLTVNSVKEDTVGTYACNATNLAGYTYKSVPLNILKQSPLFLEKPINKNLSVGMKGIFRCSVGGYPVPIISWKHKNVELDTENNLVSRNKYQRNSEGGLIINSISKEDEGSLTCSAINEEGSISGKYV